MIDRDRFFVGARTVFGGHMTTEQVNGMNNLLDAWEATSDADMRRLAYVLATVKWETDSRMQPINEYGAGHWHAYGRPDSVTGKTYFGRGDIQLTWKYNYKSIGDKIGIDLLNHPELALDPVIAAKIAVLGMQGGWFAGDRKGRHDLARYFNSDTTDPVNARRIINGLDKAVLIAGIYRGFYNALT